jgi:hypothetical protein
LVNITKWVLLGGSLILLGLFTHEAGRTSLTGTLHRTGTAGAAIGSGLSSVGGGIGDVFKGLFSPLGQIGNFARSFGFGSQLWGNSTVDPQSTEERIQLTGQGGGFDDAEQQGGGDTGINTDPIGDSPNWFNFNFNPLPQAAGIFDVGGTDIKMSTVFGQSLPLSAEARQYYSNIQSNAGSLTTSSPTGGGSNATTGGGGGIGASGGYSSGARTSHRSTGGFGAAN